jgi:hypothetical protein
MDWLHAHGTQVLYPPGDQRSNRDSYSWGLTEQAAEHLLAGGGTMQFDCSETCPWVLRCAGMWHLSAPGYTGSHLELLPHYSDGKQVLAGGLAVYGIATKPTGHHEAICHTPDPKHGNPLMLEHGSNRLVALTRHLDIVARQTSEGYPGSTFLSIQHL